MPRMGATVPPLPVEPEVLPDEPDAGVGVGVTFSREFARRGVPLMMFSRASVAREASARLSLVAS